MKNQSKKSKGKALNVEDADFKDDVSSEDESDNDEGVNIEFDTLDVADIELEDIERERKRIKRSKYYRKALKSTISVLIVVAAVSVLIATLFLPILQISGDSMSPTLKNDEIVVLVKSKNIERGDIIGFYYQGKILLKRVIATPEEQVSIDKDGNVSVNGKILKESYASNVCLGDCDLEFPYTVPPDEFFVLGDKRNNSVDSRNSEIGSVEKNEIIGKVFFRLTPLKRIGTVE